MYVQYVISLLNSPFDSLNLILLHFRQIVHLVLQNFIVVANVAEFLHIAIVDLESPVFAQLIKICLVVIEKL